MELYPLTFYSIFKEKIWGGQKIQTILNKDFFPLTSCGETWEISNVEGSLSVISNGYLKGKTIREVVEKFQDKLVGKRVFQQFRFDFPLLVKFIDAQQDLSVQVHPNDGLAKSRNQDFGKTEMWYIVQADEGSSVISGFSEKITPEEYNELVKNNTIMEVLNHEQVEKDDVFFIPAGRVHTIGKGCLIAEIQQSSDMTYRIYDYNRKDDFGNKRELHVRQALDAIDFQVYPDYKVRWNRKVNQVTQVVSCSYFTTNVILANKTMLRDYRDLDSFVILMCLEGFCTVRDIHLRKGCCVLLPASFGVVELVCDNFVKLLEVYIN